MDTTTPFTALQYGSLLSATDTVATLSVLGSLGVEPKLYALVVQLLLLAPSYPLPRTLRFTQIHSLELSYSGSNKLHALTDY